MPQSVSSVLVIIAFVMPGFITNRIMSFISPGQEQNASSTLLTAISLSCFNYAVSAPLFVLFRLNGWFTHVIPSVILAFAVFLVVPFGLGVVIPLILRSERTRGLREKLGVPHMTAKAWDRFFETSTNCWVIVHLTDGSKVAGWFGDNSFASSFPAEEDIYLEQTCTLTPEGELGEWKEGSRGIILRMENVRTLEVFEPEEETNDEQRDTEVRGESLEDAGRTSD